jgi:hypothetical protein
MTPGHGADTGGTGGWSLTASASSYTAGAPVFPCHHRLARTEFHLASIIFTFSCTGTGTPLTVTLAGATQFKGMMLQAFTASGAAAAGSFAAPAGYQALSGCSGGLAGTSFLTHASRCALALLRVHWAPFRYLSISAPPPFTLCFFAARSRVALRLPLRGHRPPRARAALFSKPRSCRCSPATAKSLPAPSPRT